MEMVNSGAVHPKRRFLVTGGAGYVGSAVVAQLLDIGHEVTVLDDLSRGRPELLFPGARFVRASIGDRDRLRALFGDTNFDCVMHFAAYALVAESVANPSLYIGNNVHQTQNLLDEMGAAGIR